MECPKCHAQMERVNHLISHAHRCTQCKGLWFEMLEYEHLKPYAKDIDTGETSVGEVFNLIDHIQCPACSGARDLLRMVDPQQPHIWFESCKHCFGRFYDAGEFRDFADHALLDWLKDRKVPERL